MKKLHIALSFYLCCIWREKVPDLFRAIRRVKGQCGPPPTRGQKWRTQRGWGSLGLHPGDLCFVAEINTVMSQAVLSHRAVLSAPRSPQKTSISRVIPSNVVLALLALLCRTQPLVPSMQLLQLGMARSVGGPPLSRACLVGRLIFRTSNSACGVYFSTAKCFGTFFPFYF